MHGEPVGRKTPCRVGVHTMSSLGLHHLLSRIRGALRGRNCFRSRPSLPLSKSATAAPPPLPTSVQVCHCYGNDNFTDDLADPDGYALDNVRVVESDAVPGMLGLPGEPVRGGAGGLSHKRGGNEEKHVPLGTPASRMNAVNRRRWFPGSQAGAREIGGGGVE